MKRHSSSENEDSDQSPGKEEEVTEDCVDEQIFKLVSTTVQWYLVLEEVRMKDEIFFVLISDSDCHGESQRVVLPVQPSQVSV